MQTFRRKITVSPETNISSIWAIPQDYDDSGRDALILAHGAGNDMNNPFLSYVHESLARQGMLSMKFNFSYKEHGRRAPDRAPVLGNTWRAMIQSVRQDAALRPRRLFLSGKSMGGRMASHLAAQGEACAGLIFLGYPLHPANNRERLRAEHLPRIRCPMLFIEGTRDPLKPISFSIFFCPPLITLLSWRNNAGQYEPKVYKDFSDSNGFCGHQPHPHT
jgi:uncharacterized protein